MSRFTSKELGIVDVHTHAGGIDIFNFARGRYPTTQNARDLVLKAHLNDIDHVVVFPMPTPLYYDLRKYLRGQLEPGGIEEFPYEASNKSLLNDAEAFGKD